MEKARHDVGSNVWIPLPLWVKGGAVFGGDREQYRYRLSRVWDPERPVVLFLMMNPSTADPYVDDRTVYRCRSFAEKWGFGTLLVGNTFAYRCTDQKRLLEVDDPVGPENDRHLIEMARQASLIVFAYGSPHRKLRYRGPEVARMFRAEGHQIHVMKLSSQGVPVHPLYLPGDLKPCLWREAVENLNPQ